MLLKRLYNSVLAVSFFAFIFSGVACTRKEQPLGSEKNPVKFYFVPSADTTLITAGAKAMKTYLEASTPYKFETAIPASYIAVVEAFGSNRADIAVLNTFGYILAREKYGVEAKIRFERFGETSYKAQIIARADGPIKKLEDINGKKFAYVDPSSGSGYILPAQLLKERSIKPAETVFAQKHDNVITMVYQGQVEAGATFYTAPHDGKIQDARRLVKTQFPDVEQKIKIVELTKDIPNDPIMFNKEVPKEMQDKIVQALLAYIKTDEGKKNWYDMYGVTGFTPAVDSEWDNVREILKTLGKSVQELVK